MQLDSLRHLGMTRIGAALAVALLGVGATPSGAIHISVAAQANIFAAGIGGAAANGGGRAPTRIALPHGSRFVKITADGTIQYTTSYNNTSSGKTLRGSGSGFGGDATGTTNKPTDIASSGGISGIICKNDSQFLVGVFVGTARPKLPAPPRLDVTKAPAMDKIAPRLNQTFMVGNGEFLNDTQGEGTRVIRVPTGATALLLGFAIAPGFKGKPGGYAAASGTVLVKGKILSSP